MRLVLRPAGALALALGLTAGPAFAQVPDSTVLAAPAGGRAVTLTVDDAVALAVERAYAVRLAELDVRNAEAQIRGAWGQLYPRAEGSANYTRSVVSANPFAGSGAGGLFGSLGATVVPTGVYGTDAQFTGGEPHPALLERVDRAVLEALALATATSPSLSTSISER